MDPKSSLFFFKEGQTLDPVLILRCVIPVVLVR